MMGALWLRALALGLVGCVLAVAPPAHAAGAGCIASPPSNGTGYRPLSNASSLPQPPAGPEILHREPATSPQLENTGVWRAGSIMISGARAYRRGEFLYQDWLYDDRALTYPDEPAKYGGNAADIVEVRVKPLADATAIRITYNTMLDPEVAAATIALGSSASPKPAPHDAGAVMPAEVFVTVHGCSGDLVRAADGAQLPERPHVAVDPARRQVQVEVPYRAFDPRGKSGVRMTLATGLWDVGAGSYQRPDASKPAYFNVAFRQYGEWKANTWMDESQNAALAAGDLSPLSATIDFRKLADGGDDDMPGQPGGVPQTGPMNRILVSHFEFAQGRGNDPATQENDARRVGGEYRCDPPACTHQQSGRLQPYSVYVPALPKPEDGYGLVINLHGAGSNYNHFELGGPSPPLTTWQMLAEAGHSSIMALPNARGTTYWYYGLAGADVFEMWADIAAHYDLDPRYVVQTGSSMGGYGTYKLVTQWPDLYRFAFPNIGPSGAVITHAPPAPSPAGAATDAWRMFGSLRWVPVLATQNADDPVVPYTSTSHSMRTLDGLGYRYDYLWFTGVDGGAGHAEYRHFVRDRFAELSRDLPPVVRDPARVTYVFNPALHEPRYGLDADNAYWVSGLEVADAANEPRLGTIDVVSRAIPEDDAPRLPQEQSSGPSMNGSLPYTRVSRWWGAVPQRATAEAFDLNAHDLKAVTLDVRRMRLPEFGSFTGTIETGHALGLRLRGAFGARTKASIDGRDTRVLADGSSVTLIIPAGKGRLRIDQPPPIALPAPRGCRRALRIRLKGPRGDRLRWARVYVNGKRVRVLRGRRVPRRITLRRRPAGTMKVKIVARTRKGRRVVIKRTYRPCPRRVR